MICGTITATTSHHLSQFLFAPNVLSNASCQKVQNKPWITCAILKSVTVKSNSLKTFINAKDSQRKETFQRQCKDYRNRLLTLLKNTNQIITINISG